MRADKEPIYELLHCHGKDKHEAGPFGLGPVAKRSEAARPAWISDSAAPGTASCSEAGGGLTCVGVSTISASQEDAEDEASDAAVEAAAFELGKRITDDAWRKALPPLYLAARDAKLAALARDAQSTQARRDVREARHAVALSLRGATPSPAARYWEAYDPQEGRRFVAFAQVTIAPGDAKKLVERYASRASALGATAMSFYPELAWRFPRLSHGAVITGLERGALQDLGLAEHYVVLGVDGRDVVDAADFAKVAGEEHAQMAQRGGSFRVLVQTDVGDPREFSTQLEGTRTETQQTPHTSGKNNDHGNGTPPSAGGVNVWDRYGGNRGSGRDDPTQ